MPIAVVLLHYNRWANLRLALRALQEQTLPLTEFHVVVADDGSTDETVEEMTRLVTAPEWMGHLHLVSGGPHHGARLSRIHNIGIANIPHECTFFIILASDMCMAPDALERMAMLHQQHPQAVMLTRLDWLPPKTHAEIEAVWDQEGFEGVAKLVPQEPMNWVEHTLVGLDSRALRQVATVEPFNSYLFNPVYALPTELFWRVGGFDEEMVSYGWQELDFAVRIEQQKVDMITSMEIRCLHIWHRKNAEIASLVHWQRQESTAQILRKHGPLPNPLSFRDWKYWRHYHRDQKGTVVYVTDTNAGLYALNDSLTHALRLPHSGWLYPLGFSVKDVLFVQSDTLLPANYEGVAEDPLGECDFVTLTEDLEHLLAERASGKFAQYASLQARVPSNYQSLQALFAQYDALRVEADVSPIAKLPLIGSVLRMFIRVGLLGKIWAAERQLLRGMLQQMGALERE